jgi:uncharacterized protein YjbJ (UPF0337 family)
VIVVRVEAVAATESQRGVARSADADRSYAAQTLKGENIMNWDEFAGNWKQVTGKVKEKWGKLTDDDLMVIAGKREQLTGLLQERYGYGKDHVEKEVDAFIHAMKP